MNKFNGYTFFNKGFSQSNAQREIIKATPQKPFFASANRIDRSYKMVSCKSTKRVVSITYEEMGLFPRSFNRVFDRFLKQLFSDVENLVLQEYRFYRHLALTTFKTLFILFFAPFLVNVLAKNYIVRPLTEYFWNTKQTEIFLNSYQQKRAFTELQDFEETLFFDCLISQQEPIEVHNTLAEGTGSQPLFSDEVKNKEIISQMSDNSYKDLVAEVIDEKRQKKLQQKTLELAVYYNKSSIESITNFFADLFSFITILYLLFSLEIQINITKSFLLEAFFGLDDSKKSLLILLITDLLVGYHSPNIWEFFFEFIFNHYGIPESQTAIFLLVATLPVLLDVLFKYLIFRHLNRSSPTTVAVYHCLTE
uniref:Potassium/proton antiporter CemA n=1 Tax=Oogamochlamys gigantea TaxID=158507 RepID=A0A0S2LMU8_9CHLO|nr:chloroplast enveloppe membrane protein [Oogamochlamys gigantea]ALO62770.1 chloroplast enveloppe membrane protein [Oogamochlamys gigantea]